MGRIYYGTFNLIRSLAVSNITSMKISKNQFIINIMLTILGAIMPFVAFGQTTISGKVTQTNGVPILGANVYIEGTYDGASTDEKGFFSFETQEKGKQTLIVSFISFESYMLVTAVSEMKNLTIKLKEDVNSLDTVVISAGTFEASDNSKVSVLKPLDVVTTASALGDFVGALQTLPGTTTVAEDGRLFVRGGDADETQIFIDGIRVFTPYTPTTNNAPTRGRYSPFLFDGITFSTGGYSSEYGQALSSVLLLNTIDEPVQEKTDISIMSVGLGLGNTKKWKKSSLSVNASYINLSPYLGLFPGRNNWKKPFEALSGETVYRYKTNKGLLKLYAAYDGTRFKVKQEDINLLNGLTYKLKNNNFYGNTSYTEKLSDTWKAFAGGSYTYSTNELTIENDAILTTEKSAHAKLKLKKRFSNRIKINFGAEHFITHFDENLNNTTLKTSYGFKSNLSAVFAETDVIFSRKFAVKVGARGAYGSLFNKFNFSPRISTAYKTGKNSQLSLAYGHFYQQPKNDILKFASHLNEEKAQHFILNYQYTANNRIFRAELYRKQYDHLVSYNTENLNFNTEFLSNGTGYAQGFDVFWRDDKTIKNVDYWLSYSFLDTQRKYKNYIEKATPPFANTHNLSVVAKYWINDWKSQLGFSYQAASGRSYTNPNKTGFLQQKTKSYHSLSINWAYLISQQKILYFSVNNVLGLKNINGYQYANQPNSEGFYDRRTIRPAADQFFFVGFFWTISDDGKENQLDNL